MFIKKNESSEKFASARVKLSKKQTKNMRERAEIRGKTKPKLSSESRKEDNLKFIKLFNSVDVSTHWEGEGEGTEGGRSNSPSAFGNEIYQVNRIILRKTLNP